jgi:hypothetical protein
MPQLIDDRQPDSPYGVICRTCGYQGLTKDQYIAQMSDADSLWRCPICGSIAQWDDARYEMIHTAPEVLVLGGADWQKVNQTDWHLLTPTGTTLLIAIGDTMKELVDEAMQVASDNDYWYAKLASLVNGGVK